MVKKTQELMQVRLEEGKSDIETLKKTEKKALEVAIAIAHDKAGSIIVVGDTQSYSMHFPNFFHGKKVYIFDKGMVEVLRRLGEIDGALIIAPNGRIMAYGTRLLKQKTMKGKGTRHAAAFGISEEEGVTAILISEEDNNIKIFKKGKLILEINPYSKNIEDNITKIVDLINNPTIAVLAGASVAAPILGITFVPGIIVFTGSYYIAKSLFELLKNFERNFLKRRRLF